jgi:hypothetical protein
MRTFLIVAASIAGIGAASAQADYTRYCRDTSLGNGGAVQICLHRTLVQCLASKASPNDRCYLNPEFAARGDRGDPYPNN